MGFGRGEKVELPAQALVRWSDVAAAGISQYQLERTVTRPKKGFTPGEPGGVWGAPPRGR
jgi:hypothetical protein